MNWIALTLAAAFLQNLRSVQQKRLTGELSVNGAAYARFCFALPIAAAYLVVLSAPARMPAPGSGFWAWCGVAAVAQMFATALLLAAFTFRSFAVSTALSKTEAVQTALIGFLLLGDRVGLLPGIGIGVSLAGVLALTAGASLRGAFADRRGAMFGLLAGAGFAVAAVASRGAALSLPSGGAALRAASTLTVVLTLQTLSMGVYLAWREPGQLRRVVAAWRRGVWVGVCGAGASVCWFTALALQTGALVRALGQVELLFALAASGWLFREQVSVRETLGIGALLVGIGLLIL